MKVQITKIDAALRQLDEAIRMFFDERDVIAIHTVASAAEGMLDDIAGHRGATRTIDLIKDDRQDEFLRAVRKAQNFFKHADRDPDATLDFFVNQPHFKLMYAVSSTMVMGVPLTAEREVFWTWCLTHYLKLMDAEKLPPSAHAEIQELIVDLEPDPTDPLHIRFFRRILRERREVLRQRAVVAAGSR